MGRGGGSRGGGVLKEGGVVEEWGVVVIFNSRGDLGLSISMIQLSTPIVIMVCVLQ